MPNHVSNTLYVSDEKVMGQLAEAAQDKGIFQTFVPLDPRASVLIEGTEMTAFATLEKDGFDGYSHATQRWGTKWGDYDQQVLENCITFYSAWSPPIEGLVNLSVLFPGVTFTLYAIEEQPAYRSKTIVHDGEVILNLVDDLVADRVAAAVGPTPDGGGFDDPAWDEYYERYNDAFMEFSENTVKDWVRTV